jgi:hypothetical protein
VETGHDNSNTFEIPVQDGFSLSQSVSTTDVTAEEAGPTPTRGSKRFNESLDPVDWSFSTYINPYIDTDTNHYLVDMIMWHALANDNATALDFDDTSTSSTVFGTGTELNVDFTNNIAHTLTQLYLYFRIDTQTYLASKAQVSQAEISIDISDIGMVAWTGQALSYQPIADPTFMDADGSNGLTYVETTRTVPAAPTADKYVKIGVGKEYLVNKLTVMEMNADVAPGTDPSLENYAIPITGASITINNNVTYLTPSTLAEVDVPIGSFTGGFEVTGSVEAYLRDAAGATGAIGLEYGSADLLAHMLADVSGSVTNAANIVLYIGGKTDQQAVVTIPFAHLSVPEVSVDDVVSTSFEFKGIPQSADLLSGDEITLEFKHS